MRIGIVNDLLIAREALRRVIAAAPNLDVAWLAINGEEAVEKTISDPPDLILMDLIMPVMDGVEATKQIMQKNPCPILVVTATVKGNAAKVYDAMGYGALDAVNTPSLEDGINSPGAKVLLEKIETLNKLIGKRNKVSKFKLTNEIEIIDKNNPLIIIGASTGGPKAVAEIIKKLPENFSLPIVIIQHMDMEFAPGFAGWLSSHTKLNVRIAEKNDSIYKNNIYIASTNDHLILNNESKFEYTNEPNNLFYRPSVDVFIDSAIRNWKGSLTGILLTGMGRDGALGLKKLRDSGCLTIAQDESTSVVFGMPKAAIEMNAAAHILPINEIPLILIKYFSQ